MMMMLIFRSSSSSSSSSSLFWSELIHPKCSYTFTKKTKIITAPQCLSAAFLSSSKQQQRPPPASLKNRFLLSNYLKITRNQRVQFRPYNNLAFLSSSKSDNENDNTSTSNNNKILPMDFPRQSDVYTAVDAVRAACRVTMKLQPNLVIPNDNNNNKNGVSTVSKADESPVTVADFAAQATVLRHLQLNNNNIHNNKSNDSFIAEEGGDVLRSNPILAKEVANALLNDDDDNHTADSIEQIINFIDLGQTYNRTSGKRSMKGRVWCLDPIDGTKGFLRGRRNGGQYCIALALLEDGIPTIGVLGCPNLPINDTQYAWHENETFENNIHTRGCIFVASKGGGCYQLPLMFEDGDVAKKIQMTKDTIDPKMTRFCLGVEKFGDPYGRFDAIARILHGPKGVITQTTTTNNNTTTSSSTIVQSIRIDSQAKHGILARGGAEIYLRFPKLGYTEWIWDHAPGVVVVTEAGGRVTDVYDQELDFQTGGAKLGYSGGGDDGDVVGIVATNGGEVHRAVLNAFHEHNEQQQKKRRDKEKKKI